MKTTSPCMTHPISSTKPALLLLTTQRANNRSARNPKNLHRIFASEKWFESLVEAERIFNPNNAYNAVKLAQTHEKRKIWA